jgi:hypothetical protein
MVSVTLILASDTTGAFLLILAIAFWAAMSVATLGGLTGLALLCWARVPRVWGFALGGFSAAVGVGGVVFFLIFTAGGELKSWAGVSIPLILGLAGVILWSRRKQVDRASS